MTRFKSLVTNAPAIEPTQTGPTFFWPVTYTGNGFKELTPEQWSLNTDGLIEKPTRFQYRNIQALPQTTQERRWVSPDGWSVKAQWRGVLLEELVKRILPQNTPSEPLWVIQENIQGDQECLSLDVLLEGQALLCHQVNGQALPSLYGGPVALMVFNRYNYKGLSQVTSLTFSQTPLTKTLHDQKGFPADGTIAPGDYYAFDLQAFRSLHGPELWPTT